MATFWEVTKIWVGNTAFIIGGGPSLGIEAGLSPSQKDPEIVFPAVRKYLIDAYGLHRFRVIGANNAFKLGDDLVDVAWFGDCGWFDRNFVEFARFAGLKVHCCNRAGKRPGTRRMRRKDTDGISIDPTTIYWNRNSGASAINLAYLLGARRVVLIAFDMQFGPDKKNNWHNEHKHEERMKKRKRLNWNPYPRFLKSFNKIARDAKNLNFEIVNATSNSALTQFKKVKLEDIVYELESAKAMAG